MVRMRSILNSPFFLWAILALSSIPMTVGFISGNIDAERMLHPTGEFSARFMIIAMAITPLRLLCPKSSWSMWLLRRRRYFGVAAFCYALAHTLFYIVDMGSLRALLDESLELGIWTGWAAFAIFVPLAITSNNFSQRLLLSWWKPLQRWVYLAAVLTLVHWIFVHNNWGSALVHFAPLVLLETFRIWKTMFSREDLSVTQSL